MRVFLTSDTHFSHNNILLFSNRPFKNTKEMNKALIRNWNRVVEPNDLVIHLGDVSFDEGKLSSLIYKLNGSKVLVRGNHDRKSINYYLDNGFNFASDFFVWKNDVFTHIPVKHTIKEMFRFNFHGHMHKHSEHFGIKDGYVNLAVELNEYTPVLLSSLVKQYKNLIRKELQGVQWKVNPLFYDYGIEFHQEAV